MTLPPGAAHSAKTTELVTPNIVISACNCEPGSSVNTVSDYGLDDRAIEVRSPSEARGLFL
jgi:hypothetical protein